MLIASWVAAKLATAEASTEKKTDSCPDIYKKLCPEDRADARLECALRKETEKRGSMPSKCRMYATGLLMNSHRISETDLATKPFNLSKACPLGLGSLAAATATEGGGPNAEWWAARPEERAAARDHILAGQPRPPPPAAAVNARVDFTLVTQVSASRLWMLAHICEVGVSFVGGPTTEFASGAPSFPPPPPPLRTCVFIP